MRLVVDYNVYTRQFRVDTVGLYDAGGSDESYRVHDISGRAAYWLIKVMLNAFRQERCSRCTQTFFDFLPHPKE